MFVIDIAACCESKLEMLKHLILVP